jgi:hypothetical protein
VKAFNLIIRIWAHFDANTAIGDGSHQLRRIDEMQRMTKSTRVKIEYRAPDALGIVVFPGVNGESETAAVNCSAFLAKVVRPGTEVLVASEINANDAAFGGFRPMLGGRKGQGEMSRNRGTIITSLLSCRDDQKIDAAVPSACFAIRFVRQTLP